MAAMLAAADGDAAVIMRGGKASTLRLALTNLDLARAAELLLRGDETGLNPVRGRRLARQGWRDGSPDLFVVDTSAVVITGSGSVDFHDETYNLALDAKSKRPEPCRPARADDDSRHVQGAGSGPRDRSGGSACRNRRRTGPGGTAAVLCCP